MSFNHESISAIDWAEEFVKTCKENDVDPLEVGYLVGWFANYWAAVNDPLQRRINELESIIEQAKETNPELFV